MVSCSSSSPSSSSTPSPSPFDDPASMESQVKAQAYRVLLNVISWQQSACRRALERGVLALAQKEAGRGKKGVGGGNGGDGGKAVGGGAAACAERLVLLLGRLGRPLGGPGEGKE